MSRKLRGYDLAWQPSAETLALIKNVQAVLAEYADFLPLALRQIFYRLVAAFGFDKTELAYRRLSDHVAHARRAGLISFDAIRDDGIVEATPGLVFAGVGDFLGTMRGFANGYERDMALNQPRYIEVICEAGGMVEQLGRIAGPYGITVRSAGGINSLTLKHAIAERVTKAHVCFKPTILLHLGDFDPTGAMIGDVLGEDVAAFLLSDAPLASFEFRRVALTAEQVRDYDLPTAPPKASDSRTKNWTGETCQLEALEPDRIAEILDTAIRDVIDLDQLDADREAEAAERAELVRLLERLQ